MSDWGVHHDDMTRHHPDEAAVEAFLAGRSTGFGDVGPVAAFADDVRTAKAGPPPSPSPQLAMLLREGLPAAPAGVAASSAAAASVPTGVAVRPTPRRAKKMTITELLAALAAKLSGLGMAAKAALGLTMAAASVATAGAAGVLPDAAQHAVATVVNSTTPFAIPDPGTAADAGKTGAVVTDPSGSTAGAVVGTDDSTGTGTQTGADDSTGTQTGADNHGACVSAVAKSAPTGAGGVHGAAVSAAAKACPKSGDESGTTSTTEGTTTTTTEGGSGQTVTGGTGLSGHGSQGHGNGQGDSGSGQSGQSHGQGNGAHNGH